ncbi:MAG: carboxypeptidase-like regulatory domain-containing protein [Bryobacteraceae bacterium]
MAGTVQDDHGEPLPGVAVQAISVRRSADGVEYVAVKRGKTDDRGHYSVLSLNPGDYIARLAGETSATSLFVGATLDLSNDHRGIEPVYYPNADVQSSAQVIHLRAGEAANISFRRPTTPAFDINGQLSEFVPQSWTRLELYREGDHLPLGKAYVNPSSGRFRVVDVPPGQYTLRAVQYLGNESAWLAMESPVSVTSEPIDNLEVRLSRGIEIPVSVEYQAGAHPGGYVSLMLRPQHTPGNVRDLVLAREERSNAVDEGAAQNQPAGSHAAVFKDVIPDLYTLSVDTGRAGYLAAAKLGNLDVWRREFPITGTAAGELSLTIRGDGASVEGQVSFQGRPSPGAIVWLIPKSAGGGESEYEITDETGHFQISGVPPGEYRIRALHGWPATADTALQPGDTLTLQAGENRKVSLEATEASPSAGSGERDLQ